MIILSIRLHRFAVSAVLTTVAKHCVHVKKDVNWKSIEGQVGTSDMASWEAMNGV